MFHAEHLYSIALRRCTLVGDINFQKLIATVGSAEKIWKLSKSDFKYFNIKGRIINDIGNELHLDFAKKELDFCEKHQVKILLKHHSELPGSLSDCIDAPSILYYKGTLSHLLQPISIVGTRNITTYGRQFITDFLKELHGTKCSTVSGLAYGVDAEVHLESLQNNLPTYAVLAHGFHTLYPSRHRRLSERIIEEGGALCSEFDSSRKLDRENFIQRNRIIAGISRSTIVVETAFGGGSISTANFANGYDREVFALPGKITDQYSQGCNQLIYQNKAGIISTIPALIEDLGIGVKTESTQELFPQNLHPVVLSIIQEQIFDSIKKNPGIYLDDLAENLEMPTYKILSEILNLELLGKIKANSGRQFYPI